ncbi:MAG: hypothetical protein FJX22_02070 [Alphaproteobacteria bacterium]|nr:hypothetical protein [Alphaproteobacteria bacterium]
MNGPIVNYCERTSAALWAEPLNAATNLAFLLAAYGALRLARQHVHPWQWRRDWPIAWLIALIALIGIGSSLFHTLASYWAMLTDVIPIAVYQISFLAIYSRQIAKRPGWVMAILVGLFLISGWLVGQLVPPSLHERLNGSTSYAPALLFLGGLALYHQRSGRRAPFALWQAVGLFLLSLTARTLDLALCDEIPIGLHFWWHLLNAGVLYLTMRALLLNWRPHA